VNLKNVPLWEIFLGVTPGSLLASMIFVDHNATSILIHVILPHPHFIFYFLQAEVTTIGFNFLQIIRVSLIIITLSALRTYIDWNTGHSHH